MKRLRLAVTGRRGSVLLHVLVTGALVALIAATLLRMSMLRYTMASRTAKEMQERRSDQASLNTVISNWNSVNTVCANNVPGYTCAPASASTPGTCGCTCTPGGGSCPPPANSNQMPCVTATNVGGNCVVSIQSAELP